MKTFLALIGVLAILAAIAAAVFFFGGFYSVAATVDDPPSVKWALVQVRLASIRRHATETPTGSLEDPAMVQAGAHDGDSRAEMHLAAIAGLRDELRARPPGGPIAQVAGRARARGAVVRR